MKTVKVGLRKAIDIMALDQGIPTEYINRKNSDYCVKACVDLVGSVNTVRAHLALKSLLPDDLEDVCIGEQDDAYCLLLSKFGTHRASFINACLEEAFVAIGNWVIPNA